MENKYTQCTGSIGHRALWVTGLTAILALKCHRQVERGIGKQIHAVNYQLTRRSSLPYEAVTKNKANDRSLGIKHFQQIKHFKHLKLKSRPAMGHWAMGPWAMGLWTMGPWAMGPWAMGS